ELQELLVQDESFRDANIAFCSEPAIACVSMHRAGKPIVGYFGVHVAFLVPQAWNQKKLYEIFRDELAE
ncbi:ubiE, partial [Symbiodinium sp. CCMP2456]